MQEQARVKMQAKERAKNMEKAVAGGKNGGGDAPSQGGGDFVSSRSRMQSQMSVTSRESKSQANSARQETQQKMK